MINGKINITTQCINLAFHENIESTSTNPSHTFNLNKIFGTITINVVLMHTYIFNIVHCTCIYMYEPMLESINYYIISPMYIKYSESSFSLILSTFQPCHGGRKASLL